MAETEKGHKDKYGAKESKPRDDPDAAIEKNESRTFSSLSKDTLSLAGHNFQYIRYGVEFCGKHPFATGLFALISLAGLVLSIVSFQIDREDAASTTEQVQKVETKLEEISEKIGASYKGGIFLYEEKIEIYWNDWWAHPLKINKLGQAEMTILGEGKTVDFIGTLSMNCSNGKYLWRGTENFYTPVRGKEKIAEIVPSQIFKNVYKLFCRP